MDQQPVTIVIQSDPWQVFKVFACCMAVYLYGQHSQREADKRKREVPND